VLTFRVVNPARLLATALGLATLLVLLLVVLRDPLPGEVRLLRAVHADEGSAPAGAWQAVSDATDLLPLAIVALVGTAVLLATRRVRSAGLLVAAVAVPWTVNPVLKELLARDRPGLWPLGDVSAHSLPAGHAANSAALVAVVVTILAAGSSRRARRLALLVGAVLLVVVAAAQLALGRHYPSDVLVGWTWAAAWVALVVSLPLGAPARPDPDTPPPSGASAQRTRTRRQS
jgi:undecaprenyl-diphosphatase